MDTISSLSSGITNIVKNTLGLIPILIGYPFLVERFAFFEIENTWVVWVVAFILIDFAGYWSHRLNHHVNLFWNFHVIHHSSEEFNLACALRQEISVLVSYFAIFLVPAALLGVPNEVILVLSPIHLFAQFWYHTQHIGKLGWLEYIIVTPSQHRVHHAINPEYIDKNLSPIFCIWDRMFGTFQEELPSAPPQYGVLKQPNTWNPVLINFQHLWRLIKDAWRTKNWRDKFRIWFMPTGWRPADVAAKYPVEIVEDIYNFERYNPPSTQYLKVYAVFQFTVTLVLTLFMFYNYAQIGAQGIILHGAFLFVGIYGYTTLMDGKKYAFWIEIFRGLAGLALIYITKDWFGINTYLDWGYLLIAVYFCITILGGIYFSYFDNLRFSS